MKALETQYVEFKEVCIAKGRTAAEIAETLKPATIEERLSAIKLLAENKKIMRKNGNAVIVESITEGDRVQRYMREAKCSFREATIMVTGKDPGKNAKETGNAITERADRWRKYSSLLSEAEVQKLAERGVEPE